MTLRNNNNNSNDMACVCDCVYNKRLHVSVSAPPTASLECRCSHMGRHCLVESTRPTTNTRGGMGGRHALVRRAGPMVSTHARPRPRPRVSALERARCSGGGSGRRVAGRTRAGGRGVQKQDEEEGKEPSAAAAFVRSPFQERLKAADDAVKRAQKNVGDAILSGAEDTGIGALLGMKPRARGGGSGDKGVDAGPSTSGGGAPTWRGMRARILASGVKSISRQQLEALLHENDAAVMMIDVRPAEDFERYHAKGDRLLVMNCPLYKYLDGELDVDGNGLLRAVRRLAYAAQGVQGVEKNASFVDEVLACMRTAGVAHVVVCCAAGGTLTATDNFPDGQSSRSLIAAFEILEALQASGSDGVRVSHLQGGLNLWFKAGGDGEGSTSSYDDSSGKVPFVAGYTVEQDAEELM